MKQLESKAVYTEVLGDIDRGNISNPSGADVIFRTRLGFRTPKELRAACNQGVAKSTRMERQFLSTRTGGATRKDLRSRLQRGQR